MLRLLEPEKQDTPPDTLCVEIFGKKWVVTEYPNQTDAPAYTCISYAWGAERIGNPLNPGQEMSSRAIPAIKAAINASQTQSNWAENVRFSYNSNQQKEEAGQVAAFEASQALWVDALCVPAADPARTICLQSMGEIFGSAHQVIVVLTAQCSEVIQNVCNNGKLGASAILVLEKEDWFNRAWTYQEAVNSRSLYFIVDDDNSAILAGQDFLRAIVDAIEAYKLNHKFSDNSWIKHHPRLYTLEALLADYLIADYATRSAYQVISAMDQRVAERADDYFYAMTGSIDNTSNQKEHGETLLPPEYFMQVCEGKGDYSFIYNTAKRSHKHGQGWRPDNERFTAVLPNLITLGDGEAGRRESTYLQLENLFQPVPGTITAEGLKAARWFIGSSNDDLSKDDILTGILARLRVLGFTGCGEPREFETGFFFAQSKHAQADDMFVVVSNEIHWVTGGPGLLLRSNNSSINSFSDVGAFIGKKPKFGTSIKVG